MSTAETTTTTIITGFRENHWTVQLLGRRVELHAYRAGDGWGFALGFENDCLPRGLFERMGSTATN